MYRRRSDVRFRVVGDEGVAVIQRTGEVLAVNGVGARLLSLLESTKGVEELLTSLSEEYEVERDVLERDVESFLSELEAAGAVEEVT